MSHPVARRPAARVAPPGTARDCPAARVLEIVAQKWVIHIVFQLHEAGGTRRFRELQRAVGVITQKELTKQLRRLERFGLVDRRVYPEVPPRVEYSLTPLGATLVPALEELSRWAERHGAAVEAHRRRYDRAAESL